MLKSYSSESNIIKSSLFSNATCTRSKVKIIIKQKTKTKYPPIGKQPVHS